MKRVISLLCIALLCLVFSTPVFAQSPELDKECSLTLEYSNNAEALENLDISLHYVASLNSNGTFENVAPFDAYDVSFNNINEQEEFRALALTLSGYISADAVTPLSTKKTDSSGKVKFSKLKQGLYLVDEVRCENENGCYNFEPFIMCLPNLDGGVLQYDVVAKPKGFDFVPAPEGTEYQVLKLWGDAGNSSKRPEFVKVDIVKDDKVVETVTLSSNNNWSYKWMDNSQSDWKVVERDVQDGYTVTVEKKTTSFVITNQYVTDTTPQNPPTGFFQTGDTRVLWPYILIFCLSGMILIVAGLLPLKGGNYEKKNR